MIPCEWTGQPTTTAAPPDFATDTWTSVRKTTPSGDGKWGFIDQQGILKVPCEWDSVVAFGPHNLAVVSKGSQSGLIDRSGKLVVPCQWHTIDQFDQQHLATVSKDKMYGKIDSTGKLVIPLKYEWLGPFDEHGLAIARSNNKFGWINVQGKEVLPIRWIARNRLIHRGWQVLPMVLSVVGLTGPARSRFRANGKSSIHGVQQTLRLVKTVWCRSNKMEPMGC